MKRFCFVFVLLFLSYQVKSQPDDPVTLLNLAEQTRKTNPERAIEYAEEALAISEKKQDKKMMAQAQMKLAFFCVDIQNFTKIIEYGTACESFLEKSDDVESLSKLYNVLSNAYFYIGNTEMSVKYSDKSIEFAEKHQLVEMLFKQYFNRSTIAYYRGDYTNSMVFALKALNVANKKNLTSYMAYCYDLMGDLSAEMSDYRKAINYYLLSLKIYLEEDNKAFIGQAYSNIALMYRNIDLRDSVRLFYRKALDSYGETEMADGLSLAYTGLAKYYLTEEKLDSAQLMIGKSLKAALLSESIKDLFDAYNTAGDISFRQGDVQKAMDYHRKALLLAIRNKNVEFVSTAKLGISRNFAAIQRFDSAYHYLSQTYSTTDSLLRNDEIKKRAYAFAEHNMKEQLEKEMKAERLQRRLGWTIVALCGLVIVIMSIFIRLMAVRQKKIETINTELNKYKSDLEIALHDKTRELILSEQQMLNLSNNLPNGAIFRFAFENAREGETLFVSSGWEELTGQSIVEAEDFLFFFNNRIHPDDSRELLKALAHAIENHTMLDIMFRFYKNNSELRWIHVRAMAIAGNNGLTYLDGYLVDETEQKRFEQELIVAKNKAEESDRLKSAFLANMSHEIRTPMNVIIGFSDLLSNANLSMERQSSYLELVQNNCRKLLGLIDDIVDISKIEADQLNLRMETFPLSQIMVDIRDYFKPIIDVEYPHVELWIDEGLLSSSLTVYSDIFRLKQIFVNLIGNALKFTEKGFVRCGQLLDRTDVVHFYVMDTGSGIAHENTDAIFQSFRKLDQYSDGTGLGLAIVKRILLQMGGSIWVESEPGVGSTFHFTLPLNN